MITPGYAEYAAFVAFDIMRGIRSMRVPIAVAGWVMMQ